MSQFSAIDKKECKDNLRDRRALFSSLSPAIFAPIFLVGLITFMLEQIQGDSEDPTEFSVIGASYAPGLIDFLASQNTIIKEIDLKQLKHRIRHASGRWPGEFSE